MNRFPIVFQNPPRNSDGGGGAPANPGAAGGEGNAPPSPPPGGGGWSMPEGFPDHLKSATRDEFFDKLQGDWKAQRERISKIPAAPKSVDDYSFEPSDKVKPFVQDLANDKLYKAARELALASGLPAEGFGKFLGGMYEQMAEMGVFAPAIDVKAEALKFLGKENSPLGEADALKELAPIAEPMFRAFDKIAEDAKLGPESKAALYALMDTADGMRAASAILQALKTPGLQPGGDGGQGGVTRQQLIDMQKDPRADRMHPNYDPNFVKQIDDGYRRLGGA